LRDREWVTTDQLLREFENGIRTAFDAGTKILVRENAAPSFVITKFVSFAQPLVSGSEVWQAEERWETCQ